MIKTIICPVCQFLLSIFDPKVEYGLYDNGEFLMCSQCLKEEQRKFWVERFKKLSDSQPKEPGQEKEEVGK